MSAAGKVPRVFLPLFWVCKPWLRFSLGFPPRSTALVLYTQRLWQKRFENFLSESGRLAVWTISGNCFVNSL